MKTLCTWTMPHLFRTHWLLVVSTKSKHKTVNYESKWAVENWNDAAAILLFGVVTDTAVAGSALALVERSLLQSSYFITSWSSYCLYILQIHHLIYDCFDSIWLRFILLARRSDQWSNGVFFSLIKRGSSSKLIIMQYLRKNIAINGNWNLCS